MTGQQIYNAVWVFVWLILAIGGICGIFAGNPAHWVTTGASLLFVVLSFTDSEEGESLKDFIINKFKAHRG